MSNIEETNPFELIDVEYSNEEYDSQEENYTEEEEEVSEDNEDIEGEETDEHQESDEYEEEYDDEEESNSYIVLQEYIDKGLIQAPENINKNLSGEELIEILNNNANAAQRAILEEEYTNAGYNEDIKKGIEFLRAGGSIEELQLLYSNESLSELDIEDDYNLENREKLIKAYYKDKGIPEDKIDSLYSLSLENDETLKDAETAKAAVR